MRNFLLLALVAIAALLVACDTGNSTPTPTNGTLAGTVDIAGPFNGAVELNVGAFAPGSDTPVQSAVAGRVTSAATADITDRALDFSFTELPFGSYEVGVYSVGAGDAKTFIYRSAPVVLNSSDAVVDDFEAEASFTGSGPFGTISGIALLEGELTVPSGKLLFVGFSPVSQPQNALQWLVTGADIQENGWIVFNVDHIAYGTWLVGLYGYDPQTNQVSVYGLLDEPVTVNSSNAFISNVVHSASFAGDPGADPELGSISGTVTFNGAIPAEFGDNTPPFLYIAANTIPPQQGSPISVKQIKPADLNGNNELEFTLTGLPNEDYSVAVFAYDPSSGSHQPIYLGQAAGTVTISDETLDVTGIDFDADLNELN
jgi:uncharacterized protein (DUF2141 family)